MVRAGDLACADCDENGASQLEEHWGPSARHEFESFVRRHSGELHGFIVRQVGHSAADDVLSETFISAWSSWAQAPASADARRSWAFGIARHRCIDHLRRVARHHRLTNRIAWRTRWVNVEGPETDVIARLLFDAWTENLTAVEKQALLLTAVDGLSVADTGRVLGCSTTAITSRLTRARKRLRETTNAHPGRDLSPHFSRAPRR
ncbi:MAG: RNA polymerase sigma factor [Kineosporiaceae bacterium]|jgi:RNA polymerase sigma-70 factor, ECF subfamily